jgi:NADH dehydrogenase FAD-containing subunit
MRAHPLTEQFPVPRDRFGRIFVDEFMKVKGMENTFAAGDVARAIFDGHCTVMSCQHGRPMGRFAGHNVVADLLGEPMLPLRIEWYVTVLTLVLGERCTGDGFIQTRQQPQKSIGEGTRRSWGPRCIAMRMMEFWCVAKAQRKLYRRLRALR